MNEIDLCKCIDEKILLEIKEYCDVNDIDYCNFVNEKLSSAIIVEKYGDVPEFFKKDVKEELISSYILNTDLKNDSLNVNIENSVKIRKIKAK